MKEFMNKLSNHVNFKFSTLYIQWLDNRKKLENPKQIQIQSEYRLRVTKSDFKLIRPDTDVSLEWFINGSCIKNMFEYYHFI